MEVPSRALFEAVALKDHERIALLYAKNARNAITSYLSVKRRWNEMPEGE